MRALPATGAALAACLPDARCAARLRMGCLRAGARCASERMSALALSGGHRATWAMLTPLLSAARRVARVILGCHRAGPVLLMQSAPGEAWEAERGARAGLARPLDRIGNQGCAPSGHARRAGRLRAEKRARRVGSTGAIVMVRWWALCFLPGLPEPAWGYRGSADTILISLC
jgi:hypothetical protein